MTVDSVKDLAALRKVDAGFVDGRNLNQRLQPKTAFSRLPPVPGPILKDSKGSIVTLRRTAGLGGKRAYKGRLGKDRKFTAKAAIPFRSRNRLYRPKQNPREEISFR